MGMDPSAVQVRREVKDLLDLQDHRGRHGLPLFLAEDLPFSHAELPQSPTQPSISSVLSARVLGSANMLDTVFPRLFFQLKLSKSTASTEIPTAWLDCLLRRPQSPSHAPIGPTG